MTNPEIRPSPPVEKLGTDSRDGSPVRYALSPKDFQPGSAPQNPDDIVDYKIGDRITRASFISMVEESYQVSRGKEIVQKLFFLWLELKYDFDFENTFTAYTDAGGWNTVFSDAEKKHFKQRMMRVQAGGHKKLAVEASVASLVEQSAAQKFEKSVASDVDSQLVGEGKIREYFYLHFKEMLYREDRDKLFEQAVNEAEIWENFLPMLKKKGFSMEKSDFSNM